MNEVSTVEIALTTGPTGAGTASTPRPLSGRIVEIRFPLAATALTAGGTGDFTFTNQRTGATVLAVTNITAPQEYHPSQPYHSTAGAVAGTATRAGVAIDDYLVCVAAQAAVSKAGTVFVTVEGRG